VHFSYTKVYKNFFLNYPRFKLIFSNLPPSKRTSVFAFTSMTIAIKFVSNQRRREPQQGPEKYSCRPSGEKLFEFFFLKWRTLVYFIFLSNSEAPKRRGPGVTYPPPSTCLSRKDGDRGWLRHLRFKDHIQGRLLPARGPWH